MTANWPDKGEVSSLESRNPPTWVRNSRLVAVLQSDATNSIYTADDENHVLGTHGAAPGAIVAGSSGSSIPFFLKPVIQTQLEAPRQCNRYKVLGMCIYHRETESPIQDGTRTAMGTLVDDTTSSGCADSTIPYQYRA